MKYLCVTVKQNFDREGELMKIDRFKISDAISSNSNICNLYSTDVVFKRIIEMTTANFELSEEQLVNILFMLCEGRKNTEAELIKYINRFGSLYDVIN